MTVIRGNIPKLLSTAHKGAIYVRYRKDGSAVVAAWPRKRPGKMPPITSEQVARWDKAVYWVKSPEPWAYKLALDATIGNGFYARDIILMETYGNYVSWPGWGRYPNGPGSGETKYPRGTLKDVNAPRKVTSFWNAGNLSIFVTLWEPSSPRLYISTVPPEYPWSKVNRQGTVMPHGTKIWMGEALGEYTATSGDNTTVLSWQVTPPVNQSSPLWWWLAEKTPNAPVVNWSTAVYPQTATGPAPRFGWFYTTVAASSETHPYTLPPAIRARNDALTNAFIACVRGSGAQVLDSGLGTFCEFSDGMRFPGTFGPAPFPLCGGSQTWRSTSNPADPFCAFPDPSGDTYTWWVKYSWEP